MVATAADPALVAVLLGAIGAGVGAAWRCRRSEANSEECAPDSVERPWGPRRWSGALSSAERRQARERAIEVARLTVGAEVWAAFMRDGYIDLPSAAEPGTCYRLRPARRVEIRRARPDAKPRGGQTHSYLCVYPMYELPAVEFLGHLYLQLRDDERRVLAIGNLQPGDGPIPNVF
ncbi:MAG TPA: hypothetical protein VFE42_32630 [Chloroflexota bacterium]|nr:hypothetical protein [Chloroflexota bacterium]